MCVERFSHIRFNLNFVVTTSECSLHVYSLESVRVVCRIMGVPELGLPLHNYQILPELVQRALVCSLWYLRSDGLISRAEIKGIRVLLVGFLKYVPNHPDK